FGNLGPTGSGPGERGLGRGIVVKDRRGRMAEVRLDLSDQHPRENVGPRVVVREPNAGCLRARRERVAIRLSAGARVEQRETRVPAKRLVDGDPLRSRADLGGPLTPGPR